MVNGKKVKGDEYIVKMYLGRRKFLLLVSFQLKEIIT